MTRFKPRRPPHGAACFLYLPSPHAQAGDKLLGGSRRPARAAHLTPREVPSREGPLFSIRLRRSQFASTKVLPPAKRLYAAGRRGASTPVGDAGTRSQAQAGNKLFRRSRRPARVAHLPLTASARRLSRSKAIPACSAIPSTSSRNSAWFSAK